MASESASACAAARACFACSMRVAIGAGLTARFASRRPSLMSQTRISPVQSAATTFDSSWLKTASSARSPNGSNSRCLPPFWSQSRTMRSRPVVSSRPSLANRTEATPPPWAPKDLMLPPFSISQSRTVPSSLAEATTFESSRQLTSVMAAWWPAQVEELAAGLRFPDDQAVVAVAGGEQDAVGAELGGRDPLGMLPHLLRQRAVGRVVDPDDLARARRARPGRGRG